MSGTAVAKKGMTIKELTSWFSADEMQALLRDRLTALGVESDRYVRLALIAATQNPKIRECDPYSLAFSLLEAAALKLEPNGVLGLAYLIPYWNQKRRCFEAKFQVGYQGCVQLAHRSGKVGACYARAIYDRDAWSVTDGTDGGIMHVPYIPPSTGDPKQMDLDAPEQKRGDLVLVYSIIHYVTGGPPVWEWMPVAEVEAIRRRAPSSKGFSPWDTDYEAMARKTVLKRNLWRNVSLDPTAQAAIAYDHAVEGGRAVSLPLIAPGMLPDEAIQGYPADENDEADDVRSRQ